MIRKIDQLRALMHDGEWTKAIKFAARFPRLGEHRNAILSASSALLSPRLYRSMGKDPEVLISSGIMALKERYKPPTTASHNCPSVS